MPDVVIKLLVVNGCSLTQGLELGEPERDSWPAILSRRLGVELVNLAREGGSNRRIVRTTATRIIDISRDYGVDPAEMLVLLLWTSTERAEYLDATTRYPRKGIDRGPYAGNREAIRSAEWNQIGPWLRTRRNRAVRAFYNHLWSPEAQHANFIVDWALLDAFLSLRGFHARYAFGYSEETGWTTGDDGLDHLIDRQRVLGGCDGVPENSFLGLTWNLPRGPRKHPLADSHHRFAEKLQSWLRNDPMIEFAEELPGRPG